MTAERPAPLGIAQDADCVTWDKLVALRVLYNEIWDMLATCSLAEGNKYGDVGTGEKHEIDTLPTVEGFFRLTVVSTPDGHGGYDVTPGNIEFILSGGTLLTRINDASYTYLNPSGPFHMVLKEACNNCSKLHPNSRVPAVQTVACPEGGEYTVYEGSYALDFPTAAPEVCGILLDWAGNLEILQDHIEMFPAFKEEGLAFDCHDVIESCCGLYDKAHYERVEGCFVLKYIDIFVDEDGNAAMDGYLTTLITASDLSEIITRLSGDLDHFRVNEKYICDKCGVGSTYAIDPNPADCEEDEKTNIACDAPLDWWDITHLQAVAGFGAGPGGSPDGCYDCATMGTAGGFFPDGIICTCDWEQLAAAMSFIIDHCCVLECTEGTTCPASLDVTLSITQEHRLANSINCGVRNDDDGHFYNRKEINHTGVNCHCYDPEIEFDCNFTEIEEPAGERVSDCSCEPHSFSVDPESVDDCINDNCGSPGGGECVAGSVDVSWTDQITQEEVETAAEGYLGSDGECSEYSFIDYGLTDRILCNRVVPLAGYFGSLRLESLGGAASKSLDDAGCNVVDDTIVVELHGTDLAVTPITLHWTETIIGGGGGSTPRSEVFLLANAWKITIHTTAAAGTTKSVSGFWIS